MEPPPEWSVRLRDISPITPATTHLRFRWFSEESVKALYPDIATLLDGVWVLYTCMPKHLLSPDRVEQLTVHWSSLPTDQQLGRRMYCTEYQHWMFATHGVEALPFWCLQGNRGGTPAGLTPRERRTLDAMGQNGEAAEPIPFGLLEPAPFDERAVSAIRARDALVKAGMDLERMDKARGVAALTAEDELIERDYRKEMVGWYQREMAPGVEFMKSFLRTKAADMALPKATHEQANAASVWRDQYIETGQMPLATMPSSRKRSMLVRAPSPKIVVTNHMPPPITSK